MRVGREGAARERARGGHGGGAASVLMIRRPGRVEIVECETGVDDDRIAPHGGDNMAVVVEAHIAEDEVFGAEQVGGFIDEGVEPGDGGEVEIYTEQRRVVAGVQTRHQKIEFAVAVYIVEGHARSPEGVAGGRVAGQRGAVAVECKHLTIIRCVVINSFLEEDFDIAVAIGIRQLQRAEFRGEFVGKLLRPATDGCSVVMECKESIFVVGAVGDH